MNVGVEIVFVNGFVRDFWSGFGGVGRGYLFVSVGSSFVKVVYFCVDIEVDFVNIFLGFVIEIYFLICLMRGYVYFFFVVEFSFVREMVFII